MTIHYILKEVYLMLRNFISIFLLLWNVSSSQAIISDDKGQIAPEILEIVSYFNPELKNSADIFKLNDFAQQKFLRPKGAERLDEKSIAHYKKLCTELCVKTKEKILGLFKQLGDIDPVYPMHKNPDYICIQGSTVPTMRERLMFLSKLVDEKKINILPATKIVFLVGERALFKSETTTVLLNPAPFALNPSWKEPKILPDDEIEAAKLIWNQLKIAAPLRAKKPLFVDAKKKNGNSRAQTEDSTQVWLTSNNVRGRIAMISSNPFVGYQLAVMKLAIKKVGLKNEVYVEGMGSGATSEEKDVDISLGILLDNLARTIYTTVKFKQIP